jgi:hypothetical protein
MRLRWFSVPALLGLLVASLPAQAQEKQGSPPMVVVRIRSIDTVFSNAKLLAKLVGKEELGRQVEGIIKAKTGPNGLDGIDTKRPLGFYTKVGSDLSDVAGVALIPISDEKAFLGLLENLNFPATKGENGIYKIEPNGPLPVELDFRFANNYAYVTAINLDAISKANLIPPATLFPPKQNAMVSATIRIDQIPDVAKQIALQQIDDALAKEKEKKLPGETDKAREMREKTLDAIGNDMAAVIREGKNLSALLDIDAAKQQVKAEISLSAKPDTKLATRFEDLGKSKSLFGGLAAKTNAAAALVHVAVPTELRQAFIAAVEEGVKKGLAKETDEGKRAQARKFLLSLEPTLKAGELDTTFILRGPSEDKHYTVIAGLKLKDGLEVEKTLRGILKDLPPAERAMIKLDTESAGDVKIHQIDAQSKYDRKAREALGDNPIYIAFRSDAALLTLGTGGLNAIKEAVAAEPTVTAPVQLQISLARLAPAFARTEQQKDVVRKVFGPDNAGQIRVTLEGGPAVRLRLTADLSVVQFLAMFYMVGETRDPTPVPDNH